MTLISLRLFLGRIKTDRIHEEDIFTKTMVLISSDKTPPAKLLSLDLPFKYGI